MPERKWDSLGKKIEPDWGPERDRSARVGIERRTTKRRAAARVGASVVALALVAGGVGAFVRFRPHAPAAVASSSSASAPVPDEVATVTVMQLSPETVVEPMPDRHGRGFALRAGGARFTVQHDAEHPLVVVAGDFLIEDLAIKIVWPFPCSISRNS